MKKIKREDFFRKSLLMWIKKVNKAGSSRYFQALFFKNSCSTSSPLRSMRTRKNQYVPEHKPQFIYWYKYSYSFVDCPAVNRNGHLTRKIVVFFSTMTIFRSSSFVTVEKFTFVNFHITIRSNCHKIYNQIHMRVK